MSWNLRNSDFVCIFFLHCCLTLVFFSWSHQEEIWNPGCWGKIEITWVIRSKEPLTTVSGQSAWEGSQLLPRPLTSCVSAQQAPDPGSTALMWPFLIHMQTTHPLDRWEDRVSERNQNSQDHIVLETMVISVSESVHWPSHTCLRFLNPFCWQFMSLTSKKRVSWIRGMVSAVDICPLMFLLVYVNSTPVREKLIEMY